MNLNQYPLWTAVVTPLLDNGNVDFESLTKVIQNQDEAIMVYSFLAQQLKL